jgi:hypothetical protein
LDITISNTDKFTHMLLSHHLLNIILTPKVSTLKCINYTPWRWPFKDWNILELHTVLTKQWYDNVWVFCRCLTQWH